MRYIITLCCLLIVTFSLAQSPVVIKGELSNLSDHQIVIAQSNPSKSRLALVGNESGMFQAEINISDEQEILVYPFRYSKGAIRDGERRFYYNPPELRLFVAPGDTIEIKGNVLRIWEASVEGGKYVTEYNYLWDQLKPVYWRLHDLHHQQYAELKAGDSRMVDSIAKEITRYHEIQQSLSREYFTNRTDDTYAIYIFSKTLKSLQPAEIENIYSSYPVNIQNTKAGQAALSFIEENKSIGPGKPMLAFDSKTLYGAGFNTKDLLGKYVLLDFWGSWCMPCRKSNPKLKELYAQYKDRGFEIIGIGYERAKERNKAYKALNEAVKEDGLPWIQFLHHDLKDANYDLIKAYNVQVFPTKVLIDNKGVVMWKGVGVKDNLESVLKEVFENN